MTESYGTITRVTDSELAQSLRDAREDRLVREGKTLCGGCDEAIHFNHDAGLWVDDGDRHTCQGTASQHEPPQPSTAG